jgi:hypothetical protein
VPSSGHPHSRSAISIIAVAGNAAHDPAVVEHELYGLGLEVVIE